MTTPTNAPGTPGALACQEQMSAEIVDSLQSLLEQILTKTLNSQVVDKQGKPLSSMCYMMLENGIPLDPADYSGAWSPGNVTIGSLSQSGQLGTTPAGSSSAGSSGASTSPPPPVNPGYTQAANVSALVDTMLAVTTDGSLWCRSHSSRSARPMRRSWRRPKACPRHLPRPMFRLRSTRPGAFSGFSTPAVTTRASRRPCTASTSSCPPHGPGPPPPIPWQKPRPPRTPHRQLSGPSLPRPSRLPSRTPGTTRRSAGADQVENVLDVLGSVGGAIGLTWCPRPGTCSRSGIWG